MGSFYLLPTVRFFLLYPSFVLQLLQKPYLAFGLTPIWSHTIWSHTIWSHTIWSHTIWSQSSMFRFCPVNMRWLHPYSSPWEQIPFVFLDVDETLVHTSKENISNVNEKFSIAMFPGHNVYVRPHAPQLMRYMVERVKRGEIKLGFWSAGSLPYVHQVIHALFDISGCFDYARYVSTVVSREATYFSNGNYIKTLDLVTYPNTLLIDDNPIHMTHIGNYGRVLLIKPFTGKCLHDKELVSVMHMLDRKYGWYPLRGI